MDSLCNRSSCQKRLREISKRRLGHLCTWSPKNTGLAEQATIRSRMAPVFWFTTCFVTDCSSTTPTKNANISQAVLKAKGCRCSANVRQRASIGKLLRYLKTQTDAASFSVANDIQNTVNILTPPFVLKRLAYGVIIPDLRLRPEPLSFFCCVANCKRKLAREPL